MRMVDWKKAPVLPIRDDLLEVVRGELKRRRLYFVPAVESLFEQETGAARVRHLIHSGILAMLLANFYLLSDAQIIPDIFRYAILQHIVTTAAYSIVLFATARQLRPRLREAAQGVCVTSALLGTMLLLFSSHSPQRFALCISYVMFIIYVNVVVRLRLGWCIAFSVIATGAALAAIVLTPNLSNGLRELTGLSLLTVTAFTLHANYTIEAGERRAFLLSLDQRLCAEQLAEYNERLSTLSATDWLTGAANRRGLERYLAQSWALAARSGQPLALLMIDVDHFKLFNDHRGHPAGDACLTLLAALTAKKLRGDNDFLARYGGEEFAVVLPDVSLPDAIVAAERIRQAVEDISVAHGAPGAGPWITVSIGAASALPVEGGCPEHLISTADAALYAAKQAGRNRVMPPTTFTSSAQVEHPVDGA